jgi:hypothetical protein
VLTSGTLTMPEAAAVAPGTRALFVVDRRSAGERRLVRIGAALELELITTLPASGVITLAPEVGSRLAVGWSNAGRFGAALLDVGEARVRVLASTAGVGTLDVAPRASEKGLEFVASTSASAEKRRVIAPLAATPTFLANLDSLLRNGR